MLREYVIGEAMHGLGIPTTRALAVVATGEQVPREQIAAGRGALPGSPRATCAWARSSTPPRPATATCCARWPTTPSPATTRRPPTPRTAYLELYRRVVAAQAALVARWMLVGFVHGVMNTDNTTISGETIDYGPCAFMDAFDPATVFSSIDERGRYAYGNQPRDRAVEPRPPRRGAAAPDRRGQPTPRSRPPPRRSTGSPPPTERHWDEGMAAKLGLPAPDPELAEDLLELMRAQHGRLHARSSARCPAGTARTLFLDRDPFDAWAARREALLPADRAAVAAAMDRVNPVYIPRNHRVEEALTAATAGDLGPFRTLLDVVSRPFTSGRAWRTTPARHPRAAPRTSPTAAPDRQPSARRMITRGNPPDTASVALASVNPPASNSARVPT